MRSNRFLLSIALVLLAGAAPSSAATFGKVVTTVGGHPSDIALDESRGQLYIANFTACEVDVMSTATNAITTSINYSPGSGCYHAAALSLSLDSRYLVVASYQAGVSTPQGANTITIIDLANNNAVRTLGMGDAPLGVAFTQCPTRVSYPCTSQATGVALVAAVSGFYLLDPASGYMALLTTYSNLSQTLPVPQATFPGQILQAQLTASADTSTVWGLADAGTQSQLVFRYNAASAVFSADVWITSPPLLPRVSVAADGSWALIGWSLFTPVLCPNGAQFAIKARYPQAVASTSITGHTVNRGANGTDTIYAEIFDSTLPTVPPYYTAKSTSFPVLSVMDANNMTVREKIYLPENLVGRALMDSSDKNMYAISDSGVTVLPVGSLGGAHQVVPSVEDVRVQSSFCNRGAMTATFTVNDPGGNKTDFKVSTAQSGVQIVSSSATTPATVTVSVPLGALATNNGTLAIPLTISSSSAVNVPSTVRLLVGSPDVNQRGNVVDVPGQLTDILPDTARNHLYVLRQDKSQLLVYDSNTFQQLAALPTTTTPMHMSFSRDGSNLMIASQNSQFLSVYNLDSLQAMQPIQLPSSHYGTAVAQSNVGTFIVIENDTSADCGTTACGIDRVDYPNSCAYSPRTLGIFTNDSSVFPATSVVSPSPDGRNILFAAPNGNVMLYSADRDTFILARHDLTSLAGAYAVSSNAAGSSQGPTFQTRYVVGDNVFDAALVPQGTLDTSIGSTVGFAFGTGPGGYRVTGTDPTAAGIIENIPDVMNVSPSSFYTPVATAESPVLSSKNEPFTRTVAPMNSGIALLTTSGFTVLAQNYDAAVAPPQISSVVSAADGTDNVAAGGLITIYGSQMSPTNQATQTLPLPTALANSCVAVNGVPVPLLFVSSSQVNAQLPFNLSGGATLSVHTPGGISNNYTFSVQQAAPSVFMSGAAGPVTGIATIVRGDNNQLITPTNPIHPKDTIVIYLTGMGATTPQVNAGMPGPSSPLASAAISPQVTIGGQSLNVFYAGLVPGLVGVYQINATVPPGAPQGMDIPLVINQGGAATTLSVRVVN